jgi:hypothetical protein
MTDRIVAQKDVEIAELKQQFESSSSMSQSDVAMAHLLDQDHTIQAEREKLQQIQAEWREKIGQAEIAISVERAKLARDRLELEEKMRVVLADQARTAPADSPSGPPSKTPRGRWLARLGLKDLEEGS